MLPPLENNPDPFTGDIPSFEGHSLQQPERGTTLDDFFGFRHGASWRRERAPRPEQLLATPSYLGVAVPRRSLLITLIAAAVLLTGLGFRAATLQLIRPSRYRLLAEGNRIRTLPLPAARSKLYDRTGMSIVENVPSLSLLVIPAEWGGREKDRYAALSHIATRIGGGIPDELRQYLVATRGADAKNAYVVKTGLSQEEVVRVRLLEQELPGLVVSLDARRSITPQASGPSFGHLLGYLGRIAESEISDTSAKGYQRNDVIGRTGIEASLEPLLRGSPGRRLLEVDTRGRVVATISEEKPVAGVSVQLTSDVRAQQFLERTLERHAAAAGSSKAAAVALDPRNGEVIALVSLPGFDPNVFARGITDLEFRSLAEDRNQPLFNRAIAGTYPSGSTIKPILAAAALDADVITPRTTIRSTGGITYAGRWFFPDWKAGGHGSTDVFKAIAESVNTFFYTIGGGTASFEGLGPERIAAAAKKFGLGRRLGIDLPGEAEGLIPTPDWKQKNRNEQWFIGDTYHLSIGQGDVLVTPLQMALATAAIANGGTLYRPRLVHAVRETLDQEYKTIASEILDQRVASPESLEIVRRGMRQTVTVGSAQSLAGLPVTVAGKTGTAEWNDRARPHAWFTGFAPYENPEIVITVLIESAGEGSRVAVPVVREFLGWYFSR